MKAMLLAAGLGTRLRPITDQIPKALVEINGRTLLQINLEKLKRSGFSDVIINLHHFPEKIIAYLEKHKNFGLNIEFSHEKQILNTGGGIKNAAWFLKDSEQVLIHNVDILSDVDFSDILNQHKSQNALVTLAVSKRPTSRQLLFDDNLCLKGWENQSTAEQKIVVTRYGQLEKYAFSGIQIVSKAFFELLTEEGSFPIIDSYLRLAADHKIKAYIHDPENWFDVGKIEVLEIVKQRYK